MLRRHCRRAVFHDLSVMRRKNTPRRSTGGIYAYRTFGGGLFRMRDRHARRKGRVCSRLRISTEACSRKNTAVRLFGHGIAPTAQIPILGSNRNGFRRCDFSGDSSEISRSTSVLRARIFPSKYRVRHRKIKFPKKRRKSSAPNFRKIFPKKSRKSYLAETK